MWLRVAAGAALLAGAACSGILGSGPHLSLALTAQPGVPLPLALEADVDGQRVRLEADGAEPSPRADVVAEDFGVATVRLTLSAGADTLAGLEVEQSFRRGSVHWVTAVVGTDRPAGHCIGALEVVPLPVRAGQALPDTMFVTHGSMPRGAIC